MKCPQLDVVHMVINFCDYFPSKPPKVTLPVGLPHPSCIRISGKWQICADLLENGQWNNKKQKNRAYTGWSSAYSVSTILLQLQSLILERGAMKDEHNGVSLE